LPSPFAIPAVLSVWLRRSCSIQAFGQCTHFLVWPMYSESRMCQMCDVHTRARNRPTWHEPYRQIGRASDDVQALFYAQPSAGMPGSCMAREWKKGRLGRPPHAPLSVCASSMSPVASRGGIAVQSLARGIGSAGEAILVLNNTRIRTECSRLICIPTYL